MTECGAGRHGIGVRVLSVAHGVHPDALRIVAPRADERERFAAAIADIREELRHEAGSAVPGRFLGELHARG
jgi:hypothetical protein